MIAVLVILNLLFSALVLTEYPNMPVLAVEAFVLVTLFRLSAPSRMRQVLAYTAGAVFVVLAVCALADALIRESLGRPLNLYLDIGLVGALVNLLSANLGAVVASLSLTVFAVLTCAVAVLVGWLLLVAGSDRPLIHPASGKVVAGTGVLVLLMFAIPSPLGGKLAGFTVAGFAAGQVERGIAAYKATEAFERRIATGTDGFSGQVRALDRFGNADVIIGFVESYGISTLLDDRYSSLISGRLGTMQAALDAAGLHVVTGRLRSPVQGGQSWLAHATLLSGQWIESQMHYDTLLARDHPTLIDDFRATGHDTVAVMPGITMAWPEGQQFGYTRIHDSDTMDYKGPRLNWVTMPDQYTWSWFQDEVRSPASKPLFAELALISSHAPWVPILPVLEDWNAIGVGEVFNQWENSGEAPVSLWRDPDRVRDHYARAIDYALHVATEYAIRHADDNTLLIILGDHQPAPLVTGEETSRDVPVHIISGNPELLEPFVGPMASTQPGLPGFRAGTLPALGSAGASMDALRPFLHLHFSSPLSIGAASGEFR